MIFHSFLKVDTRLFIGFGGCKSSGSLWMLTTRASYLKHKTKDATMPERVAVKRGHKKNVFNKKNTLIKIVYEKINYVKGRN